MANYFYRKPTIGGDDGTWGGFNDAQNRLSLGVITAKLYDDSGTLKLSLGEIGFDNGSQKGNIEVDTITSIDLTPVSSGNWGQIEVSVSGSTPTFAAANMPGLTDVTVIPSTFTAAYDGNKGGYYITATKRVIGLVWKNSGGDLAGIINVSSSVEGYSGYAASNLFKKDYKAIAYTCGAVTAACALPAAADIAIGHEIEVSKADSGYGPVMITPDGSDTIKNTLTVLFLWTQGDKVVLRWDGVSDWQIVNGFRPYMDTGWVFRSVRTDAHIGSPLITYDTPGAVAEPAIGDKILGANGSYGICIYKSATTFHLAKVVCIGATIFANNEAISGDRSGFTALINMASGAKNVDCNCYHGWGVKAERVALDYYINADGSTETNTIKLCEHAEYTGSSWAGFEMRGVDNNSVQLQTGVGGIGILTGAGAGQILAGATDYYDRIKYFLR